MPQFQHTMSTDLTRLRRFIEKWVAISLVLIYGWLTAACVLECYAEGGSDKAKVREPGLEQGTQK